MVCIYRTSPNDTAVGVPEEPFVTVNAKILLGLAKDRATLNAARSKLEASL